MNWSKLVLPLLILSSCKYYNFTGSKIPNDVKTFSVDFFSNEAQIVNPQLSLNFTEKLKTKFQSETRLELVTSEGDWRFSGAIREYKVTPATIDNNSTTAQNQFTISVNVLFEYPADPTQNFTKDFTFFRTFDATKDFSSVENDLGNEITDNIVQQIFAATALQW